MVAPSVAEVVLIDSDVGVSTVGQVEVVTPIVLELILVPPAFNARTR
jgi:hypothetical protein